jgi:AcrR family transcriptional regulator
VPTNEERYATTRAALVAAGRRLFAELGFAATSIERILDEAGVSRGGMYHHFASKEALFREVYEVVEQDLTAHVVRSALRGRSPLQQLELGLASFLDRCLQEEVRRIALLDGPTVLGWETWHEIEARYAFGLVKGALDEAVTTGELDRQPTEPLAHVVFGAMLQAGSVMASHPRPAQAKKELVGAFRNVLAGLRTST